MELEKSIHKMYRLFNVLCWLWNIYERAKLLSVYLITNITVYDLYRPDLAVSCVLTSWFQIVKYTHYVAFCCISIRSLSFLFLYMDVVTWDKWILLVAFLLDFFFKIIWESLITDQTLQVYRLISADCLCILP